MTAGQASTLVKLIAQLSISAGDMSVTLSLIDRAAVADAVGRIEWEPYTAYQPHDCKHEGLVWAQGGGVFGGVRFLLASPHLPIVADVSAEVAQ